MGTNQPGEDGYTVRGGVGGITVEYQDLNAAANQLDAGAEQLSTIRRGVLADRAAYAGRAGAGQVLAALDAAEAALHLCATESGDCAAAVRKATRSYLEAEGRAGSYPVMGIAYILTGLFRGRGIGAFYSRAVTEQLIEPPYDYLALQGTMGTLAAGRFGRPRPVTAEKLTGPDEQVVLKGGARGLLDRSAVLKEAHAPGVIEVLSIDGGDRTTYVVTLPGTQGFNAVAGPNPFDTAGNGESRAERSRFVAAAVGDALRMAEAGAGDTIILAGYSQGGDHAANIAATLASESDYHVGFLLTAGSATGQTDLPAGLPALHLEHSQDWVPGADGIPNPDTRNRVTMTLTAPVSRDGSSGLGPGHHLKVYLDGAAAADASRDPSLKGVLDPLEAVAGPGTVATRSLYRLTRAPLSGGGAGTGEGSQREKGRNQHRNGRLWQSPRYLPGILPVEGAGAGAGPGEGVLPGRPEGRWLLPGAGEGSGNQGDHADNQCPQDGGPEEGINGEIHWRVLTQPGGEHQHGGIDDHGEQAQGQDGQGK